MSIRDIEKVIAKLPPNQLTKFRAWFYKFEAKNWDFQFKNDVKSGKLNDLARIAVEDFKKGRCREI